MLVSCAEIYLSFIESKESDPRRPTVSKDELPSESTLSPGTSTSSPVSSTTTSTSSLVLSGPLLLPSLATADLLQHLLFLSHIWTFISILCGHFYFSTFAFIIFGHFWTFVPVFFSRLWTFVQGACIFCGHF